MHVMALVLALLFFMCSTSGATTHLMLEPSGGRAVLVEKRSPKEVTRQPEIIEVMPAPAEEKKGQDKKVIEATNEVQVASNLDFH